MKGSSQTKNGATNWAGLLFALAFHVAVRVAQAALAKGSVYHTEFESKKYVVQMVYQKPGKAVKGKLRPARDLPSTIVIVHLWCPRLAACEANKTPSKTESEKRQAPGGIARSWWSNSWIGNGPAGIGHTERSSSRALECRNNRVLLFLSPFQNLSMSVTLRSRSLPRVYLKSARSAQEKTIGCGYRKRRNCPSCGVCLPHDLQRASSVTKLAPFDVRWLLCKELRLLWSTLCATWSMS